MARNQLHGKRSEDLIKASGRFPNSCDHERSAVDRFDIEAEFDQDLGLPTSVKSTSNGSIGLGDARRTWENVLGYSFRMVIGRYAQFTNRKVFGEIAELVLDPSLADALIGSVSLDEVASLHEAISLRAFPAGEHNRARAHAKAAVARLKPRLGLLVLNPKIDSKNQRRLQCSLDMEGLIELARLRGSPWWLHEMHFGDLPLPLAVRSGAREFG